MSVVQAKLTISNINQTVPHAARSWCQGTIQSCPAGEECCSPGDLELIRILESMPGGDLPKLHSETLRMLQQDGPQDGPQGNFPLRSAIGMVFVMLESTIFDFHERCWVLHSLGGGSNVGEDFKETTG